METIAIIGGGAAGLAAAVAAGEAARARGCAVRVVVYEASDRVGRSILATGNGRCNFSNAVVDAARYRNGAFVAAALEALEEVAGAADAPAPEAGAAAD
ncbi:NAD(P)/FAD-dependent oxidoreductase, partial [Adlercreutzia mucosicola]